MCVIPAPLIRGTHSSHGHLVTKSMVGSSGLMSRVLKGGGTPIKRWWTLIFCIHVSPPTISDKFWPEGEGVLLCVDNVSVFTSLAILLFGVHLRVLGVLRTCGVSVVPTAHQVETPCSVTASLRWGDRSKYYINNISVGVKSIGSSALNDEIKCS